MNITDVGHLTSNQDTGEDKVEAEAKKEGKSAWQIVEFYTKAFKEDLKKLNIVFPNIWCKATDYIKEQIELVKILEKKGLTYRTSDGIYFNTSKFKDYGKLAKLKKEGLQAGKRIEMGEKKNPTDFALWKFSPKNEKRQMEWKSPFGVGFPGWHIECSAMAIKFLGNQFDIHCGGIDHIPVHHTNEIAQSEAATGKKPWVKYWLHGEFLILKDSRMGKSEGNALTLKELEDNGFSSLVYKYFTYSAHYRSHLTFSIESLSAAKNAYNHLKNIVVEIKTEKTSKGSASSYIKQFEDAINDDLDMPKAVAVLWDLLKDSKLGSKQKLEAVKEFDKILGLSLLESDKVSIPKEIIKLVKERETARNNKDWKKSDQIRTLINSKGYSVEDSPSGPKVKPL